MSKGPNMRVECVVTSPSSYEETLPLTVFTAWFVFPADLRLPHLPIKVCPGWLHSVYPPITGIDIEKIHNYKSTQLQTLVTTKKVKEKYKLTVWRAPPKFAQGGSTMSVLPLLQAASVDCRNIHINLIENIWSYTFMNSPLIRGVLGPSEPNDRYPAHYYPKHAVWRWGFLCMYFHKQL